MLNVDQLIGILNRLDGTGEMEVVDGYCNPLSADVTIAKNVFGEDVIMLKTE